MYRELTEMIREYPNLRPTKCILDEVGTIPTTIKGFEKVKHSEKMYSLDNTYNKEDVEQWIKRVSKFLIDKSDITSQGFSFVGQAKIDGISFS
jgi:DNA ligase (NAD+)